MPITQPRPNDPNTRIPAAVRRAAAEAEALHAQIFNKEGDTPPAEPAPEPAADATPPAAPTPEPAPAPAPTAQVTPASNNEPIDWEHRFNSMKGRFERERADRLALSEQLAQTQQLLATREATPAPTTTETPAELRPESFLKPEEISEYGEEFLGVVGKKAKAELLPELNGLRAQMTRIEKQLEGQTVSNKTRARHDMHIKLDEALPNWKQVNVAPEFHAWLALPDEFSGVIRHELLKTAYEQNNAPRVLAFFRSFLSQEAALDPAVNAQPDKDATSGKIPLADLAAPGRAKTAAAGTTPVEKPFFTQAQIAKFYADSAAGRYRGREEEKKRIEDQIFAAQREGRIR